jgi:lambda repressor-like predicted transcriptional regulator
VSRRTSEQWAAIKAEAEKHGWSHADVAKRLKVSKGTVDSAFFRCGGSLASGGRVIASGGIKTPKKAAKRAEVVPRSQRLLADLSPEHETALWLLLDGKSFTDIGQALGRDRATVSGWTRDPIFAAALSAVRAERHVATLAGLTALAQEMVGHHGAAVRLARQLVDDAAARLEAGPPQGLEDTPRLLDAWWKTTDALLARALEAARVLNASPVMATGGYPKTERLEVDESGVTERRRNPGEVMARLRVLEGGADE